MYVNQSLQCSKQDRLSQTALLSLIFDEQANEIQTIQIIDYNGLPDGGNFKLNISGQITQPIYYTQDYVATLARLNLAISRITTVEVSSISATRFVVEFQSATNVPKMLLAENNLTLNDVPAGRIVITTKQEGGNPGSPYALLKKLALSQWSITSFDAKTRIACVAIQKDNNWVKTNTGIQKNPVYLSIYVPYE